MKNNYFWKKKLKFLTLNAIKTEFNSYPCLGLVSKVNSGCHQDMSLKDFNESYQIFPELLSEIEKEMSLNKISEFNDLRIIGKKYEDLMFEKTKGVNTHKGLIFSLSIFYWALLSDFSYLEMTMGISDFCQPLTLELNQSQTENETVGLKLYQEKKVQGARHTALSGFAVVFLAYNFYQKYLKNQKLKTNELIFALLIFFTVNVEDTTLINKVGWEKWQIIKKEYTQLLNKIKADYHSQLSLINRTNQKAIAENISPGGAADLVVLTLILIKIKY